MCWLVEMCTRRSNPISLTQLANNDFWRCYYIWLCCWRAALASKSWCFLRSWVYHFERKKKSKKRKRNNKSTNAFIEVSIKCLCVINGERAMIYVRFVSVCWYFFFFAFHSFQPAYMYIHRVKTCKSSPLSLILSERVRQRRKHTAHTQTPKRKESKKLAHHARLALWMTSIWDEIVLSCRSIWKTACWYLVCWRQHSGRRRQYSCLLTIYNTRPFDGECESEWERCSARVILCLFGFNYIWSHFIEFIALGERPRTTSLKPLQYFFFFSFVLALPSSAAVSIFFFYICCPTKRCLFFSGALSFGASKLIKLIKFYSLGWKRN